MGLAEGDVEERLSVSGDVELGAVVETSLALALDGREQIGEIGTYGHGGPA